MPKHQYSLVSQLVLNDSTTQANSYINVIEAIAVPVVGTPFPPLIVTTVMRTEDANDVFHLRLSIQAPSGTHVWSHEVGPQAFGKFKTFRVSISIVNGPPIAEVGEYMIVIESISGKTVEHFATIPIEVIIQPSVLPQPSKPGT
jgi:hypothetical protein